MPILGLLESLGGFRGIVTTLVQPIGGMLSDRFGRKLVIASSSAFVMTAMAIYALADVRKNWHLLVPGVAILGISAISRPARQSMTAESVGMMGRGTAYSKIVFSFAVPGIFAPLIAGFLAERIGFLKVFLLGLALEALALALVVRFLKETLPIYPKKTLEASKPRKRWSLVSPKLKGFYVAVTVDAFAWGVGYQILLGLLSKAYGFTPSQLGLMSCLSSLSWTLYQIPIGKLIDRYGCVKFLMLSEVVGIIVMAGYLVFKGFEAIVALQILFGLVPAMWAPAMLTWVANSVSEGERGEEMGKLSAFRGIFAFPAPYLGGLLYEAFGFRGPIFVNMIGALLALFLIALLIRKPLTSR
jgi:MFS family permease